MECTQEERPFLSDKITMQMNRLKLRKLKVSLQLNEIERLPQETLRNWDLNGVWKYKLGSVWKLVIRHEYNLNVMGLDRRSDLCDFWPSNSEALQLIDKRTRKVVLYSRLTGKIEGLPILNEVKEVEIKYKIDEDQAQKLSAIFPQFTKEELKGMEKM